MTIQIKIAGKEHCEVIQGVFNHREIIAALGGFTHLKNLQDFCSGRRGVALWYALDTETNQVVGATEVGGRPQSHILKYGKVGVLPEFQRRGIGTALYFAMTAQGIFEGRRYFEDSIVGDNAVQFHALPKLGLELAGVLKGKVGSGKDLALFQLSLLAGLHGFKQMQARFNSFSHTVEVLTNYYTRDVWPKNIEVLEKHGQKMFAQLLSDVRVSVSSMSKLTVIDDPIDPTDERRKLFQQQKLVE